MRLVDRLHQAIDAEATLPLRKAMRAALAEVGRNRVLQVVLQELDRERRHQNDAGRRVSAPVDE